MLFRKTFLLAGMLLTAVLVCGGELNDLIGKGHKIFAVDRPRFITRSIAPYFRWTSSEKEDARYPGYRNSPQLTYFGIPVQECIFRFQENRLDSIYISVYNRGDAGGKLSLSAFEQMVSRLAEQVSRRLNTSLPPVKKQRLINRLYAWSRVWRKDGYLYTMKWSSSDQLPEYLQMEIRRTDGSSESSGKPETAGLKSDAELLKNVQRDTKGNVCIDNIPMVDQGQKGYCVVAVMERVLRYYGANISQHVFAQLAASDAEKGTSTDAIKAILRKTGGKLGIRVTERFNLLSSARDVERLVNRYNTAAKRMRKARVRMIVRAQGNRQVIDVDATMKQMEPAVYQASRLYDKNGMRAFFSDVKMHTERGLPVVWSVQLGIVPEDGLSPQSRGGHMRLLIGYNAKNREILYTDTWGAGHERKSMPLEDAWAITTLTLFLDPR